MFVYLLQNQITYENPSDEADNDSASKQLLGV
jgi:hypothetical protein